jgi:dipeptidase E
MTMRRLLLVSTSTVHGSGYLEHCAAAARRLFAGCRRLGFVPYAVYDRDAYARRAAGVFADWGFDLVSVHSSATPAEVVSAVEGLFIGGGNTFRLVRDLHRRELMRPIRERVAAGMPYMGTSAGSNVATPTLCTTNDMPIVEPPSFECLGLVPFQINPHYLDPDPESKHMGETRDQRLAEYLEEHSRAVVALREGSMLYVEGDRMTLLGTPGGRLFRRGQAVAELAAGEDLSSLLREGG